MRRVIRFILSTLCFFCLCVFPISTVAAQNSETPTPTDTPTPSPNPTDTPTPTPPPTITPSATPTPTLSNTPTPSPTPKPTPKQPPPHYNPPPGVTTPPTPVPSHTLTPTVTQTPLPTPTPFVPIGNLFIQITLVDGRDNPVTGALVILHSVQQTAVTNANGVASFAHVTSGNHEVQLVYNGQTLEEPIVVNKNGQIITVQTTTAGGIIWPSQLWIFAVIIGVALIALIVEVRKYERTTAHSFYED